MNMTIHRGMMYFFVVSISLIIAACSCNKTSELSDQELTTLMRCEIPEGPGNTLSYAPTRSTTGNQFAVMELGFDPTGSVLSVVYSSITPAQQSRLVRLHLPEFSVQLDIALGPVDPSLIRINDKGTRMVTSEKFNAPEDYPDILRKRDYSKVKIWDLEQGVVINSDLPPVIELRDLAISPDGDWMIEATTGVALLQTMGDGHGTGLVLGKEDGVREPTSVAIDSAGRVFAYATWDESFDNNTSYGTVEVRNWADIQSHQAGRLTAGSYFQSRFTTDEFPLAIVLGAQTKYLAVQTRDSILLFTLEGIQTLNHTKLSAPDTNVNMLKFNPSGSLLAIGHSKGLKVVETANMNTILDQSGTAVTALAFSHDGCYLAWGNAKGEVNLTLSPLR